MRVAPPMHRGCIFCKMRDAIFGCMGGQPEKSEELPREGNSDEVYVFDTRGLQSDRRSERCKRSPRRSGSRPHIKQGVLRLKQGSLCQKGQGQGHRKGSHQIKQRTGRSNTPHQTQAKYRTYSTGQGRYHGNYETGHCNARYCRYYEKQYERDLLKRNAERLPLLQYTYKEGRPLRGILKKPQFVRTPRIDELVFVEVGIICIDACCKLSVLSSVIMSVLYKLSCLAVS